MSEPVGIVSDGQWKAEVYENSMPGDFTVRYRNAEGTVVGEEPLSGVSSYHQREAEIADRLKQLQDGTVEPGATLGDSGEY